MFLTPDNILSYKIGKTTRKDTTNERFLLFTHRSTNITIDATGILLIAFTTGERRISTFSFTPPKTPKTMARTNESMYAKIIREEEKTILDQKSLLGKREKRDLTTL